MVDLRFIWNSDAAIRYLATSLVKRKQSPRESEGSIVCRKMSKYPEFRYIRWIDRFFRVWCALGNPVVGDGLGPEGIVAQAAAAFDIMIGKFAEVRVHIFPHDFTLGGHLEEAPVHALID